MKKIILSALLSLASLSANAELIDADWSAYDDSRAVIDHDSGLEWLSLLETQGMSISAVESMMDEGEAFHGWRLPTQQEVSQMLMNTFGFDGNFYGINPSDSDYSEWSNFFKGPYRFTYGFFRDNLGRSNVIGGLSHIFYGFDYVPGYTSSSVVGVFLVSDGGNTITSLEHPELMINYPNSPINSEAPVIGEPDTSEPDVSVPVAPASALLGLAMSGLMLRRKK